jgi:hypothetical protein
MLATIKNIYLLANAISSKVSNRLIVVDPDPNRDGNPSDAAVAGSVGLFGSGATVTDAAVTGSAGMGGQGFFPFQSGITAGCRTCRRRGSRCSRRRSATRCPEGGGPEAPPRAIQ